MEAGAETGVETGMEAGVETGVEAGVEAGVEGDMSAGGAVARRVAQAVPLLLVVSVLGFALLHAAPGGPLDVYLGSPNVRPEDIVRLKRAMGLDQPLPIQYVAWLSAFVRGDWGYSFVDGRPVMERLLERVPATLELMATSIVISLAVSVGVAGRDLGRVRGP